MGLLARVFIKENGSLNRSKMGLSWSGKKDGQESADGESKKLAKKSKVAAKRPIGILIVEKAMR